MNLFVKKLLLSILLGFSFNLFSQAPSQSDAVMLQGFYWDSNAATSWQQLYKISGDISGNFDIVWLPPSAYSSGGTGYMPKQWSNQTSDWGARYELVRLINALKANNCRSMADIVVNHRDTKSSWIDFFQDDFGTYGSFQFTSNVICRNDEAVTKGHLSAGQAGDWDTGDNFDGTRDLDHKNANVGSAINAYMKWMKNEMNYDGWRYDMVKGFSGSYINQYNASGEGYMSVGEYWDADYNAVWGWINATGKTSTAFDFPMKYAALNNGLAAGDYANMAWKDGNISRPAGLAHSPQSRRYSVTFVDNHDTYRDGSKYSGNVQQANAFILSSPGIPCVFYPHWRDNKDAINAMIKARKSVGLHSESDVEVQNTNGYYKAYSVGTCGSMLTYIGPSESTWSNDVPGGGGWTKACSGNGWAMYTNVTNSNCETAHQTGIDNGINPNPAPFTSINITVEVPSTWTNVKVHVWNKGVTGYPQITKAAWPGDAMTNIGSNRYTISLSGFASTTEVGIVFNNGGTPQTIDLSTSKTESCWTIGQYATVGNKHDAEEISGCFTTTSVETPNTNNILIYPNPADDYLIIKYDETISGKVQILDISGKILYNFQKEQLTDDMKIDISHLSSGIYFVKTGTETFKFLKK